MPPQNHLLYQLPPLLHPVPVWLKILTGKVRHPALRKPDPQILKLIILHIHVPHMKQTLGSGQQRRGKHLSQRNIHIRHAVFKIRLPRPVCQSVQFHPNIRLVASPARHLHIVRLIQGIDDHLLDVPVLVVIQGIDHNGLPENVREIRPDLRHWKCNNGKAGLIPRHIPVGDLAQLVCQGARHFLLVGVQGKCRLLVHRRKSLLAEGLHQRWPGAAPGQLLKLLVGRPAHRQLALPDRAPHIQGAVVAVVVLVLLVGGCAIISPLARSLAVNRLHRSPVENGRESHFLEILHGFADHALKSQVVLDHHRALFAQIPPHDLKSPAKALGVGVRHAVHRLLGQAVHKLRQPTLIVGNILPEPVQVTQVAQIRVPDNVRSEGQGRVHGLPDAPAHGNVRVIADKPVQDIPHLLRLGRALPLGFGLLK